MVDIKGGWDAREAWNKGGWEALDALTIIVTRFQWIMFIVSIIVGILVGIFLEDKVKEVVETKKEETPQTTLLPEANSY